jgi:diguanylate cyclase (GGDEF)-like protein
MFDTSAIRVTASFGVASFPRHGKTGDKLIGAADNALYAAKESGRNQVRAA